MVAGVKTKSTNEHFSQACEKPEHYIVHVSGPSAKECLARTRSWSAVKGQVKRTSPVLWHEYTDVFVSGLRRASKQGYIMARESNDTLKRLGTKSSPPPRWHNNNILNKKAAIGMEKKKAKNDSCATISRRTCRQEIIITHYVGTWMWTTPARKKEESEMLWSIHVSQVTLRHGIPGMNERHGHDVTTYPQKMKRTSHLFWGNNP